MEIYRISLGKIKSIFWEHLYISSSAAVPINSWKSVGIALFTDYRIPGALRIWKWERNMLINIFSHKLRLWPQQSRDNCISIRTHCQQIWDKSGCCRLSLLCAGSNTRLASRCQIPLQVRVYNSESSFQIFFFSFLFTLGGNLYKKLASICKNSN